MTGSPEARASGNELLHTLAARFPSEAAVTVDRMFSGRGLKADGRFFAFVNSVGDLVVKLAEQDVGRRVADGTGFPVTMGRRTMREWVSVPQPTDGDPARWLEAARAAYAFNLTS
jgi:TfoX/Sxy family transcriptional regulator of competence genes